MSKEHDEAVQAYKEGKIDVGITLTNGKWTICGVFNGKLDWMDLPVIEESVGECNGEDYDDCRSCKEFHECYPEDDEQGCDGCSSCDNSRRLGKNGFCAAPGATYCVDDCTSCSKYEECSKAEEFCQAEKCPQCGNSLGQCAECGCEEEIECPRTGTNRCAKFDKDKCAGCSHYEVCDEQGCDGCSSCESNDDEEK